MSTASPAMPPRDHALELLHAMLRIRRFEETCVELYSAAKIRGFLHVCIGEEAVAAGIMSSLGEDDEVVSTYREHGHALARGVPMNSVLAEMYGKEQGCSHGHGGSMHLFSSEKKFYGGHAIVGAGMPLAVGLALAHKMRNEQSIVGCLFGDGAVAEGEFHESMNLAALWSLPVVFLCENNLYAMGTALHRYQSETDIRKKAECYRMRAEAVDGMDVVAVEAGMQRASEYVRAGEGPYLLELKTYRFRAHSMFDPELYRSKEEVETWKQRGPIVTFKRRLEEEGYLNAKDLEEMEARIDDEISEAVAFAEAGTWEPIANLAHNVYGEEGAATS